MRYLGIDYGAKRVGVAVSDEQGTFAFPLVVLENSEDIIFDIKEICAENSVKEIIVGESKNYDQEDNDIMKEIRPFADKLSKTGFLVRLHPEFMTSMQAEKFQGHNDMHDASAAAIILQSFLDSQK